MYRGYIYNISGDEMKISLRDRINNRRRDLLAIVMSGSFTVKEVAKKLGVSIYVVRDDVHTLDNVHWQDCILYYGERL